MPPQPPPSIKDLVSKSVSDAQRLAKAQVALLQAEMAETGGKIGLGAAMGIAAATLTFFATIFLLLTLAFVIVALGLPIWAGMLIVAGLLLIGVAVTGFLARKNFSEVKAPTLSKAELEKTKAALSNSGSSHVSDIVEVEIDVRREPPLGS
jgi:Flp pilus assembly protein TadB